MSSKKLPQFFAAISVCIGAFGVGSIIAWTSNISDKLKDAALNNISMDENVLGWVGSIMPLGAMCSCIPVGLLADWLGRKPTVILICIPFIIGWILIIVAQEVLHLFIARFLLGLTSGGFCVVAPMYISEIAQVSIRGILGAFFQLFITMGILFSQVLGYIFSLNLFNYTCLSIPIIFVALFLLQPESPVYDLKKGKNEKVENTFNRIRGKEYDHSGEVAAIQKLIDDEKTRASFFESMKTKAAIKSTIICFMLMFYQQLSGINAVMFYALEIFETAGSNIESPIAVISIGIVQVIATIVSASVIDLFGRKVLLLISAFFMALSTFFLGIFFSLQIYEILDDNQLMTIGFIPVLSLNMFIIAFSLGLGPIPWIATGEMFTPEIKGKCSSGAVTFNWFLAFVVTKTYFIAVALLGGDITFYVFTVISFSAVFFVLLMVPETKGKTFQEIQDELSG